MANTNMEEQGYIYEVRIAHLRMLIESKLFFSEEEADAYGKQQTGGRQYVTYRIKALPVF